MNNNADMVDAAREAVGVHPHDIALDSYVCRLCGRTLKNIVARMEGACDGPLITRHKPRVLPWGDR